MTIKRYGVLDADGVKINTITADEEAVNSGWYPGYGNALVDEGENPADPPKEVALGKPDDWQVLPMLKVAMQTGDRLDFNTSAVIQRVDAIADVIAEPPAEIVSVRTD